MAKYQVLRRNYKQNLIVVADNHLDAAKLVIAKDKNLTIIEINTANQANLIMTLPYAKASGLSVEGHM